MSGKRERLKTNLRLPEMGKRHMIKMDVSGGNKMVREALGGIWRRMAVPDSGCEGE